MALISCPECGKEISDRAECCPHCGFPLKKHRALEEETGQAAASRLKIRPKVFCAVLALLLMVGAVSFVLSADERQYHSATEFYEADHFAEALPIFTDLEDYKDSQELAEACREALSLD